MATISDALRDTGLAESLLIAEQAANPATPASGYGRLYAKADGLYFIDDAGTVTGPFGTGGGGAASTSGELLAETEYNPGSLTVVGSTSTTHTDVDATNLSVAFTAPASGRVHVELQACALTAAGTTLDWGIREGAALLTGTVCRVAYQSWQGRPAYRMTIDGLVAGSAHTYKFSHARSTGTGLAQTGYGSTLGPAYLRVYDATI